MFDSAGGGVHHTAIIGQYAEHRDRQPGDRAYEPFVAHGVRVEAFVTVDAGTYRPTRIGAGSWLMKKVHVGHDALVGQRCELAPGVVIGGSAEIGHGVKVGMNATVLPFRKVGNDARIGAGAVVITDVPAGRTYAGNPARDLHPDNA